MNKKLFILLALLPIVVTLIALPFLPDTLPMHYGISGKVDRYGSKFEILILPIAVLITGLSRFFIKKDDEFEYKFKLFGYIMIFLNLLFFIIFFMSVGNITDFYSYHFEKLISGVMYLLFIILGNMLPKFKRNHFIGIRLPWTLKNDEVWFKTHRFGGKVFFYGGIIAFVLNFFVEKEQSMFLLLILITVIVTSTAVYSYNIYKNLDESNEPPQ